MPEGLTAYDLGDGKTYFRLLDDRGEEAVIGLSLHDFWRWYDALPAASGAYAHLEAVQAHLQASAGVAVNLSQCDALLRAMAAEVESLRGKPVGRLSLPPAMARQS